LIFYDEDNDKYYQYDPTDEDHPGHDVYVLYTDNNQGKEAYETSSLEYANNNGINYVEVNSVTVAEVPISYAKLFDTKNGSLSVGASIKPMNVVTTAQKVSLGTSSDDADDDSDNYETTYDPTIGLDLGFAYRPVDSKITFGLVGKNINTPTFKVDQSDTNTTEDFKIDPMVRAGVSLPVWNDNIEFAFDIDLTKNDTIIQGEQSQYVGAGIELHPSSWFSLRVGAMQDLASEKFDDGTIVTAGLGFGLKWLQFDLSAMASTNSGEYDGNSIPKYVAINASLISRWGDGYNKKEAPETTPILPEEKHTNTNYNNSSSNINEKAQKAYDELDRETNQ
jgi:hypothetical protein